MQHRRKFIFFRFSGHLPNFFDRASATQQDENAANCERSGFSNGSRTNPSQENLLETTTENSRKTPKSAPMIKTGSKDLETVRPSTFNLQPSTFNLQPSTFNLQPSTFNLHSMPVIKHSSSELPSYTLGRSTGRQCNVPHVS
jgi:hypothetical protein